MGAAVALTLTAFAAAALLTRLVIPLLVMDVPNHRSSHVIPTPRGGGIAVMAVVVTGWGLVLALTPAVPLFAWGALGAVALLSLISWWDDRHNLPRRYRLIVHMVAVVAVLALLPEDRLVFQGALPLWADRLVAALAWGWFLNLFNFMDGIDGIASIETVVLGAGVATVAGVLLAAPWLPFGPLGLVLVGAALGFLVWNWHPARVFLGDVGSIPLGFLLGWLLIALAVDGHLLAALILPAFYVSDASITFILRGVRDWRTMLDPHRSHFYQRGVHKAGLTPAQVSRRVGLCGLGLIGAALLAERVSGWAGVGVAAALVIILLVLLGRKG